MYPPSRETDGRPYGRDSRFHLGGIYITGNKGACTSAHHTYPGTAGNLSLGTLTLQVPRKGMDKYQVKG